ncbi:tetratricopeptide repeat protein [Sphingomonas jaspsi]|uniref:tetratricopeptide repeat protein n=1 Tax=Sphingomonas jaspsi TaxID=392409 RepID=UPI0004B3B877|nr:tetratricopeptide repeat protein [Sphingomonas jaspsi]
MMAYATLAIFVFVILGGLWLARIRGPIMTMIAAALMFGCAGYALQGRPTLEGSPREFAERPAPLPLTGARQALLGQFDPSDNWLNMADALSARGKPSEAAALLAKQVERHPGDFKLWIGLGNALADHAQTLTPAARLAYRRAAELAPGHPAPGFFLGLAEARSGNPEAARQIWSDILRTAPADASWRPLIEQGVIATGGSVTPPPATKGQAGS